MHLWGVCHLEVYLWEYSCESIPVRVYLWEFILVILPIGSLPLESIHLEICLWGGWPWSVPLGKYPGRSQSLGSASRHFTSWDVVPVEHTSLRVWNKFAYAITVSFARAASYNDFCTSTHEYATGYSSISPPPCLPSPLLILIATTYSRHYGSWWAPMSRWMIDAVGNWVMMRRSN